MKPALPESSGPDLRRLAWVLVGLGLAWRTARYAAGFPLFGDEAYLALSLIGRGFGELLRQPLDHGQIAPLGFLWAERAVLVLSGASERALRLVPFLAGALGLALFHPLAFRVLPPRAALLAVGLLAASYYPARHGTEVKPYGVDLFFAVALLLAALWLAERPRSARAWLAATLLAALGVWCSYPAVFVASGAAAWLVVRGVHTRDRGALLGALALGACLAASFAAMVALFAAPQSAGAAWQAEEHMLSGAFPPLAQPLALPRWLLEIHAGHLLAYPNGGGGFGSSATLVLFLLGVLALARSRTRGVALGLLLAPFALTLLAAALRRYPYGGSARVAQHLAPAICLLAGAGLALLFERLPERGTRAATLAVAALLGLLAAAGVPRDLARPYKTRADRDNRDAIAWLAGESAADDRWIVLSGAPGPYAGEWGGSAARLQYYVERAGVPWLRFPHPTDVAPLATGRTWLLAYRDNEAPFPFDVWPSYLAALESRLAQHAVEVRRFALGEPPEELVVIRFE